MDCGYYKLLKIIYSPAYDCLRWAWIVLVQFFFIISLNASFALNSHYSLSDGGSRQHLCNPTLPDSTLTIPVVVHIIHNNGSENISDDQVRNAVKWINDGLQHQNHYLSENGAAANIQLCLALKDPGGKATNGIVRHVSTYTDMTLDHGLDTIIKLATWDTRKYLNIRLVKTVCNASACNLGGFAFLPNAHGLKKDGIYLAAGSFGLDADRTVTAIHELGHYLGLYHTFEKGCKNDNCLVDGDKVCDTPPQGSVLGLCSSGVVNSCSTDEDDSSINNPFRSRALGGLGDQADDKANFMDYSDLRCQKHFSQGQVNRMRSFVLNERASLLSSPACTPPCNDAVVANFVLTDTLIEFGILPTISNTSTNGASFVWLLNGNMLGTGTVPFFSNLAPGFYQLTLIAKSEQSECPSDTSIQSFKVVCSVDAAHSFYVQDSTLFVEYNGNPYFNSAYLINTGGDTLFVGKIDSLILNPGSYLLCSFFSNGQCEDSICNWFQVMTPNGAEICNDGLDNDQDGFVDIFDKDCSCNEQSYNGLCDSDCQYLPDSFPPIEARVKWRSGKINEGSFASHIIIGDIDNAMEGSEIIIIGSKGGFFPFNFDTSSVFILSGTNGILSKKRSFGNRLNPQFCFSPLLFQNNSKIFNIIVFDRDSLFILDTQLNKINTLGIGTFVIDISTFFGSADINQDGIGEIYSRGSVFNENGVLLFDGGAFGCNYLGFFGQCVRGHSIVADFLDSDGLELAAGNKVFSFQFNNLNGTLGNTANITVAEPGVEDGSTSFGDIDGDGKLDVIVLRNANNSAETGLWVWNPRTGKIIAHSFTDGTGGSVPFVGDVDGDCVPEIGINYNGKLVLYYYDGTKNLKKKYTKVTSDNNSGVIGMTMFDLNQDGSQEIIYRDRTNFTILDGPTGKTVYSYPMLSVTGTEYPVVVDINHDGSAEILIEGGITSSDTTYVFCFESANLPWAPARSVWNQAGYHITNVNDDLTIPRQPQNNAAFFDTDSCAQTTCPQPYNTFMCQATYRTQDGCVKWPAVDLSVDALSYRCEPDSLYLTLVVRNQSDNALKKDSVLLGIYEQGGQVPLLSRQIHFPKNGIGHIVNVDTITLAIANDKPDRAGLSFRINIADPTTTFSQNIKGLTAVLECDYLNNTDSLVLTPCMFTELCNDTLFNNQCSSECVFFPDSLSHIDLKLKWKSEAVSPAKGVNSLYSNILSDSYNNLYTIYTDNYSGKAISGILTLDGKTGKFINKTTPDTTIYTYPSQLLMFLNENNLNFIRYSYGLRNEDANIGLNWFNVKYNGNAIYRASDFNGDGEPEIYGGDRIYSSQNGKLIFDGVSSEGCNSWSPSPGNLCSAASNTIAADFTDSPGLELACGNIVYEFSSYTSDTCMASSILGPFGVKDGFTATADINLDGQLDVVVVSSQVDGGKLWVWDPRTKTLIAEADSGIGGSLPAIGNVDDDCYPEIVISYINFVVIYKFDGTTLLKEIFQYPKEDNSGCTGVSMFDFNQDGKHEIIFRDLKRLVIADGEHGVILGQVSLNSGTAQEYPVIADIDGDDQAEILINGFEDSDPDSIRIFCFESANLPWAPARSVWNQAGYHITNVNDDLTIPRQPQKNAAFFDTDSCAQTTCPQPYNTFMCQATYRTQDGCVKWPAVDLSVDGLSYRCEPDSLYLTLVVRNQSDNALKKDSVLLGIYEQGGQLPLLSRQIHFPKDGNDHIVNADTITLAVANDKPDRTGLSFRINIADPNTTFSQNIKGLTAVLECDYLNNMDSLALSLAPLTLDLGPDITKCRTAVFTLQAPANFVSYVWSDGSTQDSYTSATSGMHVLTATDVCGRIYTDSVRFEVDSSFIPQLGNDTLICEDELLIYDLAGFDQVQWLPASAVSCDTCLQTVVIADTNLNLVALTNVNGCIDADTVNISVQALKKRNENLTICSGDSVLFHQTYLSEPGSYEYRTGFCDSLVTLDLTVLAPDSIMLPRQTICEGDSAFFLGKWWKTEINSTIKLKNQYDCDSFITFELRVIDTLLQRTNASVCQGDSLFTNGQWLKDAGIYTFNYTTPEGCDSIEEVHLTLLPTFTHTENTSLCAGDSLQRWGRWFKATGTYSQAFATQNGCDSTEVLQLTVNPLITDSRQYEICEGSTLTLNGIEYSTAGSYTTQLQAITGCDTLLTFTLTFSDRIQKTEKYKLCPGDSININGQWIDETQTLQYTLEEAGCITEITAEISLLPQDTSTRRELLCPGDSIFINGSWHLGTKDFSYTLNGSDGCDSIVNAYITSLTWPQPPVVNLDCEVAIYEATIDLPTSWQVTWSNGDTTATTQITTTPASATIHYGNRCFKTFDLMTTSLPDLNTLPSIADQNISPGQGLPLTVPLDANEWKVKWLPSTYTSCDTCFTTMLYTDTNATITLELTHISGCTYTRTFNLIVENPPAVIVIPNVLSPLTPGPNASWDFTLPPGYTLISASVYDRWGSHVFQGLPPWDGTFNNCPLLPGVYVYTIQYLDPTGNTVFLKGDVTLL